MRPTVLLFLLLLLIAPAVGATETEPRPAEVVPQVTGTAPAETELRLAEVHLEERAVEADDAALQGQPARGSFWWMVGVIVVAGVILAVLL